MPLKQQFRRLWRFLQRENIHRSLAVLLAIIVVSSIGVALFEPNISLVNSLWWTIVTLTTVGYGDVYPITLGGRMIAMFVMFVGIGVLGMLSATLASLLVSKKIKEDQGMSSCTMKKHLIICEWNHRAHGILKELRADPKYTDAPIALIAEIERKPIDDDNLLFIQGSVNDETLQRANLAEADTIIVLGDDRTDEANRDAKVVLATLTIESINPDAYTIVELVDEAHVQHCKRARANEIIVSSDLSSGMIARATLDHGVTTLVSELLSSRAGAEIYKLPLPAALEGCAFIEALTAMKRQHDCLVVALQKGNSGDVISNPPSEHRLERDDVLFVIATERPTF